MVWCFRCVRNLVGAVIALASLLALTEVALRVQRLTDTASLTPTAAPLEVPSAFTGWELPPSIKREVLSDQGEPVVVRTNSTGLRGEEIAVPKPAGTFRIVICGDEAVLAAHLPDETTLSQRIGQRLQSVSTARVEVVNAGLPHAAPETLSILYRQRLSALQPDLVVLHVHAGDVAEDRAVRKWLIRDARGRALVCTHPDLGGGAKALPVAELRREFAVVDRLWTEFGQSLPANSSTEPTTRLTRAAVEQMLSPLEHWHAFCQATGAAFVVCLAPTSDAERTAKVDDGTFTAASFAWIAQRRIPVIDGAASLQSPGDFRATANGWTAAGHSHLADFIALQIYQNLRGPWSTPSSATPTAVPASYTPNH